MNDSSKPKKRDKDIGNYSLMTALKADKTKISFRKVYFLGSIAFKDDNYERAKEAILSNDISWIFSAFKFDIRIDDLIDFYYTENDQGHLNIITCFNPWEFMCRYQLLDIFSTNPKILENIQYTILFE